MWIWNSMTVSIGWRSTGLFKDFAMQIGLADQRDIWTRAFMSVLSESAIKLIDSPGSPATGGEKHERLVEGASKIADLALQEYKRIWCRDDDYLLMPQSLTAENGAKAAMAGAFRQTIRGDDELGEPSREIVVTWSTIKAIYAKAVHLLGRRI